MDLKDLPESVQSAFLKSAKVSEWIDKSQPREIPETPVALLAGTQYAICIDHRDAILLLIQHGSRSAAFALWRTDYEALLRGQWAELCADEAAIVRIIQTRELPSIDTVVRRLDRLEPNAGETSYGRTKARVWKAMSHYAHNGVAQLSRWAGAWGIGASHPDDEVVELLGAVDVYGTLACMCAMRLSGIDVTSVEVEVWSLLFEDEPFPAAG